MDYHQDIARSSYADMLNDDERNHAYYIAIRATVSHMVKSKELNPNGDRFYKCCDIGTGSGLLSMMLVRTFRSLNYENFHVTAFEAFAPMAECASRVIAINEKSDKITVISGRSEECKANPKFNLLVAELLDTELIGEGCLLTYRHAVENLCALDCIFIPQEAKIYIQPIESKFLLNRQLIQNMRLTLTTCNKPNQTQSITVKVSDDVRTCCGLAEIDDMQLSQLDKVEFNQLSEPKIVFEFKFGDIKSLRLRDKRSVSFKLKDAYTSWKPIVIAMWWDIVMYDENLFERYIKDTSKSENHSFNILSCAPNWQRQALLKERDDYVASTYGRGVWREHWIQGVYYLQSAPQLPTDDLTIYAHHDSHSLWFDTKPCESKLPDTCTCGVHRLLSRSDIAFLNNGELMSKLATALLYRRSIKTLPTRAKIVFNRRKVSRNSGGEEICSPEYNDHRWQINFWNDGGQQLPEVLFDYKLQDDVSWSRLLARHSSGKPIAPFVGFEIKCLQVCFKNLNRIRTNVILCQNFNLTHLDELINHSSKIIDSSTESHHLHEYECQTVDGGAEAKPTVIFSSENLTVDERNRIMAANFRKRLQMRVPQSETFNELRRGWAVVFWADFKLVNGDTISSGFTQEGRKLAWNPYFKQLVHFLHDHPLIKDTPEKSLDNQSNSKTLELEIGLSLDEVKVGRLN